MKDRMERLVVLPFTVGCVSSSSVSVSKQHGRRPKEDINSARTGMHTHSIYIRERTRPNFLDKLVENLIKPSKVPTSSFYFKYNQSK